MKGITERVIRMLQRYKNILVPIDGSYEAELAFKKAVEVAKRNGKETKLQLVHVVDTVLSKTFQVSIQLWLNK